MSEWRADLQCFVESLSYDFSQRYGVLRMAADSCTDMAGCIKLFESIDPKVERIDTAAGDDLDTVYALASDIWTALSPPREQRFRHDTKDGTTEGKRE